MRGLVIALALCAIGAVALAPKWHQLTSNYSFEE